MGKKTSDRKSSVPKTDEEDITEFVDYLKIDRDSLDEDLIQQPMLFYRVSQQLALANARRDKLKREMELLEAETRMSVREDLARHEEKVTEKQVTEMVNADGDLVALEKRYGTARFQAEQWGAMKESFSQRGYALKELVSLYLGNYFGEITDGTERGAARERLADEARKKLADRRRADRRGR
jgi:hypothetical protein